MATVRDFEAAREEREAQSAAELRARRRSRRVGVISRIGAGSSRLDFLDETHAVWESCADVWRRNERRLRGGDEVLGELRRFMWESRDPRPGEERSHYEERRERAIFFNLPDRYATTTAGHLMTKAPQPGEGLNFGGLGEVRRVRDRNAPTQAEMVYFNCDGAGNDGSHWDVFWAAALKRAQATGHRWIMVESSKQRPRTYADELAGLRPYLREFSPLDVTNWEFDESGLAWAVVRVHTGRRRVERGRFQRPAQPKGYLLLVRQGVSDLGSEWADGGWWLFDGDKLEIDSGNWASTRGAVPLFPLYWAERDSGSDERPTMSRMALTELGAIAVSLMDMLSAWMFDTWDAAQSLTFLAGVDADTFNLAMEMIDDGNRYAPLKPVATRDGVVVPTVHDGSTGTVAAMSFDSFFRAVYELAERIAVMEATGVPESSGLSKVAGFNEEKAPRFTLAASNLEQAQNTAIHFLELRWGHTRPSGETVWPREFDLVDLLAKVREQFELEKLSGLRSATLGKRLMTAAARERGFLGNDQEATLIESEYGASAAKREQREEREASLAAEFGVE